MTKAQEVYERVEALVAAGTKKADAFRTLADEYGQPFNSIRGSYYAHTRTLGSGEGSPSSPRSSRMQRQDPIAQALAVLQKALDSVDDDIAAARGRAEEAQAEYEQAVATADERKGAIQAKINALQAS